MNKNHSKSNGKATSEEMQAVQGQDNERVGQAQQIGTEQQQQSRSGTQADEQQSDEAGTSEQAQQPGQETRSADESLQTQK